MKKYGIYKIQSPSGKCYIGRASHLYSRLNKYKNGHNNGQHAISRAIEKYGWDNMTVEILWQTNSTININDILNELERDFISLYDCLSPNGYNIQSGGNNFTISKDGKERLSRAMRTVANGRDSKYHRALSDSGKKTRFKKGRAPNKKAMEKLAKKLSKVVIQFDINGKFIREWKSNAEASRQLNISSGSISRCCNGQYKQAKGFIWKYQIENKF